MRSGPLRHRITFDAPLLSQGQDGEELVTWTNDSNGSVTVWGTVEPLHGREQLIQAQQLAPQDTRITVRWSTNVDRITPKWRARRGLDLYDIKSVAHIDLRHRMLEIMCQSGVNSGG